LLKIYGKENVVENLTFMFNNDKIPNSILFYGEAGVGKKVITRYFATKLLCLNENKPCGICRNCVNIEKNIHPDVIWCEHSGKLQGFSVETVRNICSEAYIRPNDGDKKIYIFSDADYITKQAQNSLLKLIEEPPEFAYFVFTSTTKDIFLKTILSRITSIAVTECDLQNCKLALFENGFSQEEIELSTIYFGKNIGMCEKYLKDDTLKRNVELTKTLIECIMNKDEYSFLQKLCSIEKEKDSLKTVLYLLNKQVRDLLTSKYKISNIGFDIKETEEFSKSISSVSCERIHELIQKAYSQINKNVNLRLISASLCAQIMNIL